MEELETREGRNDLGYGFIIYLILIAQVDFSWFFFHD